MKNDGAVTWRHTAKRRPTDKGHVILGLQHRHVLAGAPDHIPQLANDPLDVPADEPVVHKDHIVPPRVGRSPQPLSQRPHWVRRTDAELGRGHKEVAGEAEKRREDDGKDEGAHNGREAVAAQDNQPVLARQRPRLSE